MSKLLAAIIAAAFAFTTAGAIAAKHEEGMKKDGAKKEEMKKDGKKAEKKAPKKQEAKKEAKKDDKK